MAGVLEIFHKGSLIIISLILVRIYNPENFALWSFIQTILFFVLIGVEFSCHQNGIKLLVTSGNSPDNWIAIQLYKITGLLLSSIALVAYFSWIAEKHNLIYPVLIYAIGVALNQDYLLRANGKFNFAAIQNTAIAVSMYALCLYAYFRNPEIEELINSRSILYTTISILFLYYIAQDRTLLPAPRLSAINITAPLEIYKKNFINFSIVLIAALLARSTSSISIFFIEAKLSKHDLGLYMATSLFYLGFITLKGVVITQIFPKLCSLHLEKKYFELVLTQIKKTLIPITAAAVFFIYNSELTLITLFGPEYVTADTIHILNATIILCALAATTILIPTYMHVAGRYSSLLAIMATCSTFNLFSSWFLVEDYGIVGAFYATAAAEVFIILLASSIFIKDNLKNNEHLHRR